MVLQSYLDLLFLHRQHQLQYYQLIHIRLRRQNHQFHLPYLKMFLGIQIHLYHLQQKL